MAIYLDASAIAKLVNPEKESASLRRYLDSDLPRTSSAIAMVEVLRAAKRHESPELLLAAREALARLALVDLDEELLEAAGLLEAPLRTLDAIHLATALAMSPALEAFVTYDRRLLDAARAAGLVAVAPGQRS